MAEEQEAQRVLDALEAFTAAGDVGAAERRAFLAGVWAGINLERQSARDGLRHVGEAGRRHP